MPDQGECGFPIRQRASQNKVIVAMHQDSYHLIHGLA